MATWVLVANKSIARVFELNGNGSVPLLVDEFQHPAGRLHEGDLTTDNGAAVFQSAGSGQQRSTGPEVEATEHEARLFAKQLAEHMRLARSEGRYESMGLVCAPAFLGKLREFMDHATAKLVTIEIDKNIAEQHTAEIQESLQTLLER